jgi:hypothetical protein
MGYNLYITRRKRHFDPDGPSISEDEWRQLVDSDPELRFEADDNIHTAFWNGPSEYPDPWFAYDPQYGAIDTKNPDGPMIYKMLHMASLLGAKVQGDDLEVYRTPTDTYFEDDETLGSPANPPPAYAKPWWKRLLGRSK